MKNLPLFLRYKSMLKIPDPLRSLFIFTAAERRAAYWVAGLLMLTVTLRAFLPLWIPTPRFPPMPVPPDLADVKKESNTAPNRPFSPDTMKINDWVKWGVPVKLAKRMVKFKAMGGKIRDTSDLKKIYGMDPQTLNLLKQSMVLPTQSSISKKIIPPTQKILLDLNRADSESLVQLPGIGPFSASKIVSYRNRLGGFVSIEQLREVRGLSAEWLDRALPLLKIEWPPVRLKLNADSKGQLSAHPYISYKLANWIEARRKQKPFVSSEELKEFPLVTDSLFVKMAPYLEP